MPKKHSIARDLIEGMRSFVRLLKSARPIEATRVERYETPDGPMHVCRKVTLLPPEPSTYLDDAGEWQSGRRNDTDDCTGD